MVTIGSAILDINHTTIHITSLAWVYGENSNEAH